MHQNAAFCTLKLAQTADGFLGKKGEKTAITDEKFREKVLHWRDLHQSIFVGANTILADDCVLSGKKTNPLRLVFLEHWNADFVTKKFFRDDNVLLVTFAGNAKKLLKFLEFSKISGVSVLEIAEKNGKPDFWDMKKKLFEKEIFSVFVEGGGKTAREMLAQNAVEQVILAKTFTNLSANFPPEFSPKSSDGVLGISEQYLQSLEFLKNFECVVEQNTEKYTVFVFQKR